MFGHDNQDDQQKDQNSPTPLISPAPDELVQPSSSSDDSASSDDGVPPFDTSSVALDSPSSDDTTSAPKPKDDSNDDLLSSNAGTAVDGDLINIKQDALQQLTPLVDHLDQTPEEKFKTTMMMIQASDDQSLVKAAYDAAKQIKDDKIRAQALLDIINEINYFTQQSQN